jgi:Cytochrome c554 and c-prime
MRHRAYAGVVLLLTGGLPLVAASDGYAGSAACAPCHQVEFTSEQRTPMSRALQLGEDADILRKHASLKFREGIYFTSITREGNRSFYTVTDGTQTIRVPLDWAFGVAVVGQTYVLTYNGDWYESRLSYYGALDNLDVTMGHAKAVPRSLEEALGRKIHPAERSECFACHATGGVEGREVHFQALTPGVQCENCHGPAAAHVASMKSTKPPLVVPAKLSQLTTEEMSDFCGRCHRTWAKIATDGPHDIRNLRFQPYRLVISKCYDAGDARIRCAACHEPHRDVETKASAYDNKCRACHNAHSQPRAAKVCVMVTRNCVTCHMPKIDFPGAHHTFTDHDIRIAHSGEKYPD